jgi:hypothetical protein
MATIADDGPSRSASRAENYKRNTVRPGIDNTNASGDNPLVKPSRFDAEQVERDKIAEGLASITKDSFKKKKAKSRPEDATPISAESDEQWPGTY